MENNFIFDFQTLFPFLLSGIEFGLAIGFFMYLLGFTISKVFYIFKNVINIK